MLLAREPLVRAASLIRVEGGVQLRSGRRGGPGATTRARGGLAVLRRLLHARLPLPVRGRRCQPSGLL